MEKEDNRKYLYDLHDGVLRDLDGKELPGHEAVKILNQQREQIKELEKQVELKQKYINILMNKTKKFFKLAEYYNVPFEKLYDTQETLLERDEKRKEYIRHLEGKIHRLKKRVQILEK